MKELTNLNTLSNKKLLVVLPINKINDVFLNECFYSLAQQSKPIYLLVLTNNLSDDQIVVLNNIIQNPSFNINTQKEDGSVEIKTVTAENKINYVIENTNATTFPQLFNEAFNYADINNYETFSVIEGEDVVDVNWFANVEKYSKAKSECHVFLPVSREVSNGNFLGFFNEAAWSEGLAEVAGVYDTPILMRFNCINVTGAVLLTEEIKKYSESSTDENGNIIVGSYKPMKESMKLNYIYEFFLRMIYNDVKVFTVPRVGYEHRIDLVNDNVDYFSSKLPRDIANKPLEKGGVTVEELKWYDDLAKKEYFYDTDRKVEFKSLVVAQ